ncbi:MFS transporter [Sphaerisporangium sp. NPDC049002]|uniref:MFS transporter n=1 Tax=Sphaerisporangium sp. NPDC049002 TaxID=3155392 RepID=UPI0033FCEE0C
MGRDQPRGASSEAGDRMSGGGPCGARGDNGGSSSAWPPSPRPPPASSCRASGRWPSLRRDLSLSTTQLGLLLSAAQLVPLAGLLVAGELLDRYGERWVVGIGAGVIAVSLAMGSLAPGYESLLLVLLIVGAGYGPVEPGGSKSVASWFDSSQRRAGRHSRPFARRAREERSSAGSRARPQRALTSDSRDDRARSR